jgi:cytochrome c oxidase subunit 2
MLDLPDMPSRRIGGAAARAFLPGALGVVVAGLALSGCALWPADAGYPYTTTDPVSDFGLAIHELYAFVTYVVLVTFALVSALLAFTLVRFKDDGKPGNPEQIHGNLTLEIGWTMLPIVIVLFMIVPTVQTIFKIADTPPRGVEDANGNLVVDASGAPAKPTVEINVIGKRWWWAFEYPALGITTGNQMAFPDDRPVSLLITSDTVIHSFWLPRVGGKRDAIPGRVNRIWFNIDADKLDAKPGAPEHIRGECAEYCGEAHALMRFEALAMDGADFEKWAVEMKAPLKVDADVQKAGQQAFQDGGCVGCHAIAGFEAAKGKIGPNLTAFGDRRWLAAGVHDMYPNGRDDTAHAKQILTQWIRNPDSLKPGTSAANNPTRSMDGMAIPLAGADGVLSPEELSEEKVSAIVDYLLSMKTSFPLR